jgi:hypothetical protein
LAHQPDAKWCEKVLACHALKSLEEAGLAASKIKEYFMTDIIKAFEEAFNAAPMIGCANKQD